MLTKDEERARDGALDTTEEPMRPEGSADSGETSIVATVPARPRTGTRSFPIADLTIRPPFSTLFDVDEKVVAAVAESIRTDGFSPAHPVMTWLDPNGELVVVDGHQRIEAARAAGLVEILIYTVDAPDERAALEVAIREQRDRRNLTKEQIAARALRVHTALEATTPAPPPEAQHRGLRRGAEVPVSSIEPTGPTLTEKVAELTGTSIGTMKKIAVVARHADEETKAAVLAEKLTVDAAYRRTREATTTATTKPSSKSVSKKDPRDPRLDELDKILRSLAVIPRGKGDKAKAVLVLLGDAVIRLARTMGSIARKSEIELGRHLAMLDAIVETVEELTWREATPEHETQVALHVAEVWGVTSEEVVANGELAAAIDTLKATDPEIEAKFLSGDGPSQKEILERARALEEDAPDVLTCERCKATAPLGARIPHRAPCVTPPKAEVVVASGQVWKTQHGKFFLVERVVDDKAVVNLGDGQASGWTEIARVLGEATLVPTPTKAVLATFERPSMESSIGPKRRRK